MLGAPGLDAGGASGIVADGTPDAVLRVRGAELAAGGVWVPGIRPAFPAPPAPPPGETLLTAESVVVSRVRGTAVAGPLHLAVRAGEALGIVGPNGSGKSTLGLTLAGLLRPESGRVAASPDLTDGAKGDPITWSSRALLTRIGTVFQDPEHQLLTTTVRAEVFVDDPDSFVARAVAAGADCHDPVRNHEMPWGPHRQGGFFDPYGHLWLVGDKSPLRSHASPPRD